MNIYKRIFSITLIALLLIRSVAPVYAVPEQPESPETSEQPETPETAEQSEEPEAPSNDDNSQTTENDTNEETNQEQLTTPEIPNEPSSESPVVDLDADDDEDNVNSGTSDSSNQMGDVTLESGDASAQGAVLNTGNQNLLANDQPIGGTGQTAVINSNNGSDSENSASISDSNNSITFQNNDADLNNNLTLDSNTGDNNASRNTGGDTTLSTGEADTTGSITNIVNTNAEGVMLSEFNIVDDHVGDIVLDFAANCVIGCSGGTNILNANNGEGSINDAEVTQENFEATFQNNDANVENELVLSANTGNNIANDNTGGNTDVTTGDANVSGNILNFLNNNFSGNVLYGVVNIFGDLTGDILIPDELSTFLASAQTNLSNTNNGSESENSVSLEENTFDSLAQFNSADIVNNLDLSAMTGDNSVADNTGGNNSITTGDSNVDVNLVTIANNNIIGGNWWLVVVNEAGKWVGKIFGLPGSTIEDNMAASSGELIFDEQGNILASNQGNSVGSQNNVAVDSENTNEVTQTNSAAITNNVSLDANTGGNSASRNTGGDNSVTTGDANVMVNIVNFVNNNFIGGNVLVTVVNVFGNWFGDFIAPGGQQQELAQEPRGGTDTVPQNSQTNSQNNNNSSAPSTLPTTTPLALLTSSPKPSFTPLILGTRIEKEPEESDKTEVLAYADTSTTNSNNKIRINLALLLPFVAGGVVIFFVKKKIGGGIS